MRCKKFFEGKISFKIGRGDRIRLWEDKWCCNMALSQKFLGIYEFTRNQQKFDRECVHFSQEGWEWDLALERRLSDRQTEEFASLMGIPENIQIEDDIDDELMWED